MGRFDKLIKRFLTLDKDIRFDEIEKVMKHYGFRVRNPRGGSSHYIFDNGKTKITIPKHTPIKLVYIKMVRDIIEMEMDRNE